MLKIRTNTRKEYTVPDFPDFPRQVSIRSQPEGWEIHGQQAGKYSIINGFNPLPARRLGDTPMRSPAVRIIGVSIRSQPEGWEIRHGNVLLDAIEKVSIRSQPEGWEIQLLTPSIRAIGSVSIRSQPEGWEIQRIGARAQIR